MRPWFLVAWSGLWSLVWYQFFDAFFRNLVRTWPWGHSAAIGIGVLMFAFLVNCLKMELEIAKREDATASAKKEGTQGHSGAEKLRPFGLEAHKGNIFDPYAVLELQPPATPEQIKNGYRRAINLYHPDKVQHLGLEFRKLAHEKTIQIRRAFEMLSSAE